jgi:hypothetical protein
MISAPKAPAREEFRSSGVASGFESQSTHTLRWERPIHQIHAGQVISSAPLSRQLTSISFSTPTTVGSITSTPSDSTYSFDNLQSVTISGTGVLNDGPQQTFVTDFASGVMEGQTTFTGTATAGTNILFVRKYRQHRSSELLLWLRLSGVGRSGASNELYLADVRRICAQSRPSNRCSDDHRSPAECRPKPKCSDICGSSGTRTHNQRLKRALLYRLSYRPVRKRALKVLPNCATATENSDACRASHPVL